MPDDATRSMGIHTNPVTENSTQKLKLISNPNVTNNILQNSKKQLKLQIILTTKDHKTNARTSKLHERGDNYFTNLLKRSAVWMYFNVASRIFVFASKDNFSRPYKRIWSKFPFERIINPWRRNITSTRLRKSCLFYQFKDSSGGRKECSRESCKLTQIKPSPLRL